MAQDWLAIDFGTSNSAVAVMGPDGVERLSIETNADTLPTAVFFPAHGGAMQIGTKAAEALIAGEEGRYMRALKSVLGTALFHEPRIIGGKRRTLADVVSAFLREIKHRAEAEAGRSFHNVLSGRPVHFHSSDPDRDSRAEADLRACYHAAGFGEVTFMAEPEAAAVASHGLSRPGRIGLIVDIGGGTSDFSLFRVQDGGLSIIASHGIRLGGTDFDQSVSLTHAMPRLGYGSELRREFGPGLLPVPNAVFVDLATWAKIPFLYTPETRRDVTEMVKRAVQPKLLRRLGVTLEHELGHELAFATERGKIAANMGAPDARVDMGMIEPGLCAPVTADTLAKSLAPHRAKIEEAIVETLALGGVGADQIASVILVGGSSLMGLVMGAARNLCPEAELRYSEAFTAVVDGLALSLPR